MRNLDVEIVSIGMHSNSSHRNLSPPLGAQIPFIAAYLMFERDVSIANRAEL